jgi:hypothetical protein
LVCGSAAFLALIAACLALPGAVARAANQLDLAEIRRKNRNTFSTSRKIDAAISRAVLRSFERRSR